MEVQKIYETIKQLESELEVDKELERQFHYYEDYQEADRVISSKEIVKRLEEEVTNEVKFYSLIPTLDLLIDGFEGGEMIIISGPTKMGKTSFARTLTENFELKGIRTLWFSYEEPMRQFIKKFKILPLFYAPAMMKEKKTEWIDKRIIEAIAKFKIQAVFIDNLHFLIDLEMSQNASLRIGKIIGDLKTMAIRYNIVIFLLAHIKKIAYDQKPTISDIRDSSLIAQTSDCVMMINRLMINKNEFSNDSDLYVQTHRRTGVMGKIVNLTYFDNQYKEINYEDYNKTIPVDLPEVSGDTLGII